MLPGSEMVSYLWRAPGETLEKGAELNLGTDVWGCHQIHDAKVRLLVCGETFPNVIIHCCPQPVSSGIARHSMKYVTRTKFTHVGR